MLEIVEVLLLILRLLLLRFDISSFKQKVLMLFVHLRAFLWSKSWCASFSIKNHLFLSWISTTIKSLYHSIISELFGFGIFVELFRIIAVHITLRTILWRFICWIYSVYIFFSITKCQRSIITSLILIF